MNARLSKFCYLRIKLCKNGNPQLLLVHRLVCSAFHLNPHSKPCVDYSDNNSLNNLVQNLRWATHSENGMNRVKQRNNKTGVTGVDWHKATSKWRATIQIDDIRKHLGCFDSVDKAKSARIKAVNNLFGKFANNQTNQ
mmetsp:Transcript_11112/g.22546  ORF Transcript_11112/g.22546 Transcript_11112/m.22546 type:complete len:138 (-) Transcript_11112:238-651(-)